MPSQSLLPLFNIVVEFVFFLFVGVLMILAGSLEFEKGHNNEIQERPSDNIELPEVETAISSGVN